MNYGSGPGLIFNFRWTAYLHLVTVPPAPWGTILSRAARTQTWRKSSLLSIFMMRTYQECTQSCDTYVRCLYCIRKWRDAGRGCRNAGRLILHASFQKRKKRKTLVVAAESQAGRQAAVVPFCLNSHEWPDWSFPAFPELRKTKTLNADMYSTFMRTRSNIVRLKGQSSEKCSEKILCDVQPSSCPAPRYTPLPLFMENATCCNGGCFCCHARAIISLKRLDGI